MPRELVQVVRGVRLQSKTSGGLLQDFGRTKEGVCGMTSGCYRQLMGNKK